MFSSNFILEGGPDLSGRDAKCSLMHSSEAAVISQLVSVIAESLGSQVEEDGHRRQYSRSV